MDQMKMRFTDAVTAKLSGAPDSLAAMASASFSFTSSMVQSSFSQISASNRARVFSHSRRASAQRLRPSSVIA